MKRPLLILSAVFLMQASLHGSGSIMGHVMDLKTGAPLPGANVQLAGTVRGASADNRGFFRIDGLPAGVYTVRASMISYKTAVEDGVSVQDDSQAALVFQLEETAIELNPIVVLGGKIEQRLDESAVSLSVITNRDILKRNPTNLIQAMETAAGVHFVGDQINIRGSTGYTFGAGNKVLLLLDGVPVYASDTGQFNWDMLPPLDIERIEILKGAGSTLWGASALGGVVNVITRQPTASGQFLFSSTMGLYGRPEYDEWIWTDTGRLHYTRTDASFNRQFGPFGMRISVGRYQSTGYTQIGDFRKSNLVGKFDYRFSRGIKWTVYAAYSNIYRGFFVQWKGPNNPYEVDESNLDNYAGTNQLNLYTKLAVPVSPVFGLNIRASMVRSLMGNQFGKDSDFNPAIGQGMELQSDWIFHPDHTLTAGLQYQHDTGSTKYTGDHKGFFLGPYVQDEWRIRENLRLTAGFRYDRYQLVGGKREDLFSPRLGVNWRPWARTVLRGSVGSGFRAATIVERFLELTVMNFKIVANPQIKAESSWAYDVGLRQTLSENWNIDISLFDNEYWELIEAHLDLIRGQIQFRNIPRARIQGLEAAMNASAPTRAFGLPLTPGLQLSLTAMNHENLAWHEPLTYRPDLLVTVKTSLSAGPVAFEADWRYASRIEAVKVYPINKRVPMKFFDIRLAYSIYKLKLQAGIENLFNYNYAPMESNLMPMRTFTAGLQGEF